MIREIAELLKKLREKKPLIHQITNYVTVTDCANITLGIGASPIMADDEAEAASIASVSSALVINIGTLNKRTIESMILAGVKANEVKIPVIFDPVGAGASELRNETTMRILKELKVDVIRGNLSEIRFIAGLSSNTKGVDSADAPNDLKKVKEIAEGVSRNFGSIVAITGPTDVISDGKRTFLAENGNPMMSSLTGTGCMCTAVVGSFCGADTDLFKATISGILSMGIAGEIAFEVAGHKGNESYHTALMDEISKLCDTTILERAKLYEM